MFVVEIEGTDGVGKSTLISNVEKLLKEKDVRVGLTREVGNPHDPVAVELRKIVLDPKSKLTGMEMEFIFAAMRLMKDRWLLENREFYDVIVNDRGLLSHLAYTDHNVDKEFTNKLYRDLVVNYTSKADLVLRIKLDTNTALERRRKRNGTTDAIEAKGEQYQRDVSASMDVYIAEDAFRKQYPKEARLAPYEPIILGKSVVELDGSKAPMEVAQDAVNIILAHLSGLL
jgi:dTMP kinase